VARQVWRAFCRPGTSFIACRRGRGTSLINGREIVPVDKAQKRHWRSVAVEVVSEPENCHGAECLLGAAVRVRVQGLLRVLVSGSVSCKKHDKQLTFIVRVRFRGNFKTVLVSESCLVIFLSNSIVSRTGRLLQLLVSSNGSEHAANVPNISNQNLKVIVTRDLILLT